MPKKLLFLPGAIGSPEFWKPIGDRLPLDLTPIYLGWPGLGNESQYPSVSSFDDLVRLVETAAGSQSIDLVAQSMGGVVALMVALRCVIAIDRIVLAATSGGIDATTKARLQHDWAAEYHRVFPHAARWISQESVDLTDSLRNIHNPVLLLFGTADPIAPVWVGERMKELLPNATLHAIEGADHDLVLTHTSQVLPLIAKHLEINHFSDANTGNPTAF